MPAHWSLDLDPRASRRPSAVGDIRDPRALHPVKGHMYFPAESPLYGRELWATDGTAAGTALAVPTDPQFDGVGFFAQWYVLDPASGRVGALAASELLDIVVGS